jgi:hypothetical protein
LTGLADGAATNTRARLSADEPVAIPLPTAEKSVLHLKIRPVIIENVREISFLM